jgi:hypothetical protein
MDFKRVINSNLMFKRGQVTIFIIIAIFIIAAVAAFLIYRNSLPAISQIPLEFQPAYNTFLSCIEDNALTGISILESQGGYISLPEFEAGSSYMPFSSQLNFLGNPIPYWYYVSGNNIEKEQVPTQSDMETQLAQFIDERIGNCDFSSYANSDFQIQIGTPTAKVSINQNKVAIALNMNLNMNKGNQSVFVKNHKAEVNSELGNLYSSAKTVYNYEQTSLFLENYTIDVLRNYAPVDGVEISCSPMTWNAYDIVANLTQAIGDNIMSLHSGNNVADYFTLNIPVQGVNFLTSPAWPRSFEINPTEESLLIAQPVGNQAGLGILGFCYVPYHFVYDIKYPVLVTVSSGEEIFQFPVAVIIDNNKARTSLNGTAVSTTAPALCQNKNTNIDVSVFDSNSNSVDADVSYECIGDHCDIGKTSSGTLTAKFPQCVGGYIVANADGFAEGRYSFTTTHSGSVNIILDKLYNKNIDLKVDGNDYNGNAVINFISPDGTSKTAAYPQQKSMQLSEGYYTIQVYIYENSSIKIGATTKQQCVDVKSGIAGVLGISQQECFDIKIPEQIISNALTGGGQAEYSIIESQLKSSGTISINAASLPKPDSLEQVQENYLLLENKLLTINFE